MTVVADSADGGAVGTAAAKAALRARVRAARRTRAAGADVGSRRLDGEALASSVTRALRDLAGERTCRVAAYQSLPNEPPTEQLIAALLEGGHDVILPVLRPDLDLDWASAAPETATGRAPNTLGVRAIREAAFIVTPGLAVDAAGARLGQGGGSYDRSLARRRPDALVVTLLFDDELLTSGEWVPTDPHDVRVDAVLTPSRGLVRCSPTAPR